jgi:hypothetical protein
MQAKHTTILTIFILIALGFVLGLNTLTGFFTLAEENPVENQTNITNETSLQEPSGVLADLSFEETRENTTSIPANWFWNNNWDNKEEDFGKWDSNLVYLNNETTHSGKPSLTHKQNSFNNGFAIRSRNIKVTEGKTYQVKFYVKTNASGKTFVPAVSWILFDKDGSTLDPTKNGQQGIEFNSTHTWEVDYCDICGEGYTKVDMENDNDWKLIKFEFTVPAQSNAHHVMLIIDSVTEGYGWSYWYLADFTFSAIS